MVSRKRNGGVGGDGSGSKWISLVLFGVALLAAGFNYFIFVTLSGQLVVVETPTLTATSPSKFGIKIKTRNDTSSSNGAGVTDVISTDRVPSSQKSPHEVHRLDVNNDDDQRRHEQHTFPTTTPTLILHVGPMKTATTTIQLGLANNTEILKSDSVHYLGKCDQPQCDDRYRRNRNSTFPIRRALFECILLGRSNVTSCGALRTLSDTLDRHRALKHHIVVSAEEFCRMVEGGHRDQREVWGLLRDTFAGFNVRIVVGYRRLYDWVPSMHNQGQKPRRTKPRWKPMGNVKVFPQAYEYYVENPSDHQLCTTRSLVYGFRRHFTDVEIFNMHRRWRDDDDHGGGGGTDEHVLANFVCTHIPEAPKTCEALRGQGGGGPDAAPNDGRSNPSFPLHLYFMAITARTHGVLNNTVKVLDAVRAMGEYEKSTGLDPIEDFPWSCITPEQERLLLNRSLEMEGELLPTWASTREVREAHLSGFEVARSRKKFCSVDAHKALGTNGWMAFIRKIDPS